MSLHALANHMAAHGRGPDDHLIHMSGKEVAGLQALAQAHGGSLTRNPHTGLPEAGFLDSILPTVIGAAGMYFGVDPMTTAAIMGGGTALNTGDLGKGLMAGLGAYGGGSMVGGLGAEGALTGISPDEAKAATLLSGGTQEAAVANAADAFRTNVGAGLSSFADNPSASALGGYKNIAMAGIPAVMGMMQPQRAQTPQGTQQMIRPYTFAANPQTGPDNTVGGKPMIGTKYTPGQDTSERTWFNPQFTALEPYKAAEGGLMDLSHGGMPVERMSTMADATNNAITNDSRYAAGGGISSLGSYSDGGQMLKGPGDGMSDNIPAQIDDKRPARLADGEFVVPADVVSHLGNGSTDAGAKQLYKMMDKVRQARTGRKAQGKQINPNKFVPA